MFPNPLWFLKCFRKMVRSIIDLALLTSFVNTSHSFLSLAMNNLFYIMLVSSKSKSIHLIDFYKIHKWEEVIMTFHVSYLLSIFTFPQRMMFKWWYINWNGLNYDIIEEVKMINLLDFSNYIRLQFNIYLWQFWSNIYIFFVIEKISLLKLHTLEQLQSHCTLERKECNLRLLRNSCNGLIKVYNTCKESINSYMSLQLIPWSSYQSNSNRARRVGQPLDDHNYSQTKLPTH